MIRLLSTFLILTLLTIFACSDDGEMKEIEQQTTRIAGEYAPEAYELDIPEWLPDMVIPANNPMTVEGVELGRHLFYDPILSVDSTISCASCHFPELSFTDAQKVSRGVGGALGDRNAMSLANVGFNTDGLFWDGRSQTLEEQALVPIKDHREMNDSWDNVERKLSRHEKYPEMFRAAFGIEFTDELDRDLVVKAIAQFERTLISGNSRFDRVVNQNIEFPTDSEFRGFQLFFFEELPQAEEHPGCSHCHGGPMFTDQTFRNNGIENVSSMDDFPDKGLGKTTGKLFDNGKFKVPSLRNIALTAPYMHDGRFETLEEVLDHYSSGGNHAENLDPNIQPFTLTEQDKQDLINFLDMLTDTTFVNNPAFQNPFN